jgi:hypothetical protein
MLVLTILMLGIMVLQLGVSVAHLFYTIRNS